MVRKFAVIAAFGIAVVFVLTLGRPDVPVLPACAIGTLISGIIGQFGVRPGTMLTIDPLMIGLMGFIVMPLSWGLMTLAQPHTSPNYVKPVNASGVSAGAFLGLDGG